MRIYDISEPITPQTAVFPGDNPYSSESVMRIADGAACSVSTMRMSVHCGTHADAPLHFEAGAEDASELDLDVYIGKCRVVEVPGIGSPSLVDPQVLAAAIEGAERVLIRTRPSHDHTVFDPDFTALGPAAADVLVAARVRLVGIDSPSMDHASCKELGAHHRLRAGRVGLLENLDLSRVALGDYELIAPPLKLVGADAAPVRALLRELP